MKRPINSRNKGATGEREIANMFREAFPELADKIHRNPDQARNGGYDILGLEPFAIEVKRAARPLLKKWWMQAVAQADAADGPHIPVLIYRIDRGEWRVLIPLLDVGSFDLKYIPEISLDLFYLVARQQLELDLDLGIT